MICSRFVANTTGSRSRCSPASVSLVMLLRSADAKTSAGAPSPIWVTSSDEAAKLNVTLGVGVLGHERVADLGERRRERRRREHRHVTRRRRCRFRAGIVRTTRSSDESEQGGGGDEEPRRSTHDGMIVMVRLSKRHRLTNLLPSTRGPTARCDQPWQRAPPSTTIWLPVMKLAPSLQRKTTTSAISRG